MHRLLLILVLCFVAFEATAQRTETVEAEYIYHAPENISPGQAKQIAVERAQIKAIADEFGTTISQTNLTNVSNINGESGIDFQSIGMSEVKGEWIETLEEPKFEITFEQEMLVVKVYVKGKAREIIAANIDCEAKLLRNGKDDKFESSEFQDGDQFFLSFRTPAKGYIAIYQLDNAGQAYCLLPYPGQEEAQNEIKANKRYLFFDWESGNEFTEEYYMTCGEEPEHNQLYIIFSPNKFMKALDDRNSEELPRELAADEFQEWLAKNRRRDKEMQLIKKSITIKKK